MYLARDIVNIAKQLYDVELSETESVVQTLRHDLVAGQTLDHKLFSAFVTNENFVSLKLLFSVAHRNLQENPPDWRLLPRVSLKLGIAFAVAPFPGRVPAFIRDCVNALETPGPIEVAERIEALLKVIVAWGPNFSQNAATKLLPQTLIEKYIIPDVSGQTQILLYKAFAYEKVTITQYTPLLINTIRHGTVENAWEGELLIKLAAKQPALQSAAIEALILSNRFSPEGYKLVDDNTYCLNTYTKHLDAPFEAIIKQYTEPSTTEALDWKRCLYAMLLTDPEQRSAFNNFLLSKHRIISDSEFDEMKQSCTIYAELCGPFTRDTLSMAIDSLMIPHLSYDIESTSIFDTSLLSDAMAI